METDWGHEAQKAAQTRLAYCNALLWDEELAETNLTGVEVSEPVGPYCGCDTCVVREILDAAWPIMLQAARDEIRQEADRHLRVL